MTGRNEWAPSPWRWPGLLAAATMLGLLGALLGQHAAWLWMSWGLLVLPPIVVVAAVARAGRLARRRRAGHRGRGRKVEGGKGRRRGSSLPPAGGSSSRIGIEGG
ncbi:hypothetical protein [Rhodopila sp.]|jgi:hypothetical protein|uniref:hypothetical protein n=1 Tax=Rhodopila sp. TaxID=2480087 RepID=UPI002B848368|nr:hypothetical protein [Rhodopila sp.]HVZ07816.1 hypothetical protein [Rhodopila sp.]